MCEALLDLLLCGTVVDDGSLFHLGVRGPAGDAEGVSDSSSMMEPFSRADSMWRVF